MNNVKLTTIILDVYRKEFHSFNKNLTNEPNKLRAHEAIPKRASIFIDLIERSMVHVFTKFSLNNK